AEPGPDDERGEDVGGGLDGVGHQGVGVAEDTGQELDDHEGRVDQQAGQGGLHPAGGPCPWLSSRFVVRRWFHPSISAPRGGGTPAEPSARRRSRRSSKAICTTHRASLKSSGNRAR